MRDKKDYGKIARNVRRLGEAIRSHRYFSEADIIFEAADAIEALALENEAMKRLLEKSLEKAARREWVSVDERLPDNPKDGEHPTKYNVVIDFSGIRYADGSRLEDEVDTLYFYDDEFRNNYGNVISVTHWMPLPEPPEVEK